MSIIEPPKVGSQPVAVKIVTISQGGKDPLSEDAVNAAIAEFFAKWQGTHVLSAPVYMIGSDGSERLYLQAVDRVLWLIQNEEQGIAQARGGIAAQEEAKRLQSGVLTLAASSDIPGSPPKPPGRGRVVEGRFP